VLIAICYHGRPAKGYYQRVLKTFREVRRMLPVTSTSLVLAASLAKVAAQELANSGTDRLQQNYLYMRTYY
jgi:hypothetical protein